METEPKYLAADLLLAIWKGIPADYKRRYRLNVWKQFEERVRSASCQTNSLGRFVNLVCSSFDVNIQDVDVVVSILEQDNDAALLKMLRDETTLIIWLAMHLARKWEG